jgi:acyl-CoA thioester hydrolase
MSQAPPHALEIPIELRWSDQDLLGHVNNAKLMTLAEEARIRSLERLRRQLRLEGPLDMVLRTTQTDFLRPVMYEDAIKVLVWISRIGNTSYVMQHELIQNGEVCVSVEAVVVMFDSQQQAPMPLPDEVRAALESVAA